MFEKVSVLLVLLSCSWEFRICRVLLCPGCSVKLTFSGGLFSAMTLLRWYSFICLNILVLQPLHYLLCMAIDSLLIDIPFLLYFVAQEMFHCPLFLLLVSIPSLLRDSAAARAPICCHFVLLSREGFVWTVSREILIKYWSTSFFLNRLFQEYMPFCSSRKNIMAICESWMINSPTSLFFLSLGLLCNHWSMIYLLIV